MNYLTIENVSKSFGEKVLFNEISFTIAKGQKIALIAKNGTGKTSLLRVLAGEESVEGERAKLLLAKDVKIGYLKQEPHLNESLTVLEAAFDTDNARVRAVKELEKAVQANDETKTQAALIAMDELKAWDIEARFKEILGKLKLQDFTQKVSTLSGGQKKRLALGKLLIEEPDFLILDEPTNHLDMDMIEWLEGFLSAQKLTLLMVTHDRYFLERICNEIIELDDGQLFTYRGNYSDYLEKKSERDANDKATLAKTKILYKRELNWMRRQPKARTTKAKSRIDSFYSIKEKASKNLEEEELTLEIDMSRLGNKILEAHQVSKAYDDLNIIEKFNYKFKKGERIGLAGSNGVGKTTFIKLLTQEIKPDAGKVIVGDTVVFGYYAQENDSLDLSHTIIESVRDIAEYIPLKKGKKLMAESLLERFLFPRSHQQVRISQLSGGEKRRLLLLRVLMKNPNFLILDEPTNDLDVLTLNVLEDFLKSFKGCLLVVTHDRFFMDKLVDHLFVLEGGGKWKDYNGSYSSYRNSLKATNSKKNKPKVSSKHPEKDDSVRKLSYLEKKEIRQLEKDINKLETRKKNIESEFEKGDLSNEKITELSVEIGEIKNQLDEKETRWLELSEFL